MPEDTITWATMKEPHRDDPSGSHAARRVQDRAGQRDG